MLLVDVRDRLSPSGRLAATGDERAPLGHADEEREPAPRLHWTHGWIFSGAAPAPGKIGVLPVQP